MDTTRNHVIRAGAVETFEVWLGANLVATECGYGIDHAGAAIEPALETAVPSREPVVRDSATFAVATS